MPHAAMRPGVKSEYSDNSISKHAVIVSQSTAKSVLFWGFMSSQAEKVTLKTVAEYLHDEETAAIKHEYVDGRVFAMTGANRRHNLITGNIFTKLHAFLDGSPCRAFMEAFKVRVEAADAFYYPDVMVACDNVSDESVYTEEPVLIVEVLSPSTAAIDRREKCINYMKLSTLREYMIVHQRRKKVEMYRRIADGTWTKAEYYGGDNLVLNSFPNGELVLSIESIYRNVSETGSPFGVREGPDADIDYELYKLSAEEAAALDW